MEEVIKKLSLGLHSASKKKSEVDKIYKIHKYWARKPWNVVDSYILKYSNEGDLIVDPFCGSGLIGCESISLNRNFLGIDLNPMSIRISEGTCLSNVDLKSLENDYSYIEKTCKEKILSLYRTDYLCEKCCSKLIETHLVCGGKNIGKSKLYCQCGNKISELKNTNIKNQERVLKETYWVPKVKMPKPFFKDRFSYKGISEVKDFFSPRALSCLSFLLDTIYSLNSENEDLLLLAFSNTILHCSKLKGENVRPMSVNNYWLPNDIIDENVWFRFEDRFKNLLNSKKALIKRTNNKNIGKYNFINGSALNQNNYKNADYIFTDPPYGETIQYSELSFVWNAWLKQKYKTEEEIIINPVQNKKDKEFNDLLDVSLENIYSSLKNEGYFTLCFANKEFKVWERIINKCKNLGFELIDIESYDTYGTPFNKNWAKFSPKSDIYITFKKVNKIINSKYDLDISLENIIDQNIKFFKKNKMGFDVYKLYDLTIAVIIWMMFYNKNQFDINNLSLKSFVSYLENKKY